ncbi:hypothetical protein Trydic_g19318 [Trypoxylus dichotomus]
MSRSLVCEPPDKGGGGSIGSEIRSALNTLNSEELELEVSDMEYDELNIRPESLLQKSGTGKKLPEEKISWVNNLSDFAGEEFLHVIEDNDLYILNNGNHTLVDISVCSPNLAPLLTWDVVRDTLGSDHLVINMKLSHESNKGEHFSSDMWNLKKLTG